MAPWNSVETQQFDFVHLLLTRARNITLSKLEWNAEKCLIVIVKQFSPSKLGSWTIQNKIQGLRLLTPLGMSELTPAMRLFKQNLSVGPSDSAD